MNLRKRGGDDNKRKQRYLNEHGVKVPIDGSWGPWQAELYKKIKASILQNVAKQKFLRRNGVNVKVDGSWGPWQELLYQRFTTKDKYYQSTPLGLLSYLYDKTLGSGTTYKVDPLSPYYNGEIKADNRSTVRRYIDLSMKDNTTPLGYITQTVLPAAAVSYAIVYGGPAVRGLGAALLNPLIRRYAAKSLVKEGAKGFAGATAVNLASKATTGKTWGELVALSTGVSPELGEFTNIGVYGPTYLKNVAKRGVETAMRTTHFAYPTHDIVHGAKHIFKHDPKRMAAIGAYISTGARFGNKGYYNSFSPNYKDYYGGFWNFVDEPIPLENDLIDAFLYKKRISPEFGVKKLDTKDYGVHTEYVKKHYPDKDILIYETLQPTHWITYPEEDIQATSAIVRGQEDSDIFRTNTGFMPNVGGHQEVEAITKNGTLVLMGLDIWKFNPNDYIKRWGIDDSSTAREKLSKLGLKLVDHLGTPVITRTKWIVH